MSLGLATRGYVSPAGGGDPVLTLLYPSSSTARENAQVEMAAIFAAPVGGDQVVSLSSDDPSVTVPSSVTVLSGQQVGLFTATTHGAGTATITATHATGSDTASIEVVTIDPTLKPEIHDTVNLKPDVVTALNLRPKIYDTEES